MDLYFLTVGVAVFWATYQACIGWSDCEHILILFVTSAALIESAKHGSSNRILAAQKLKIFFAPCHQTCKYNSVEIPSDTGFYRLPKVESF